MQFIRWIVTGLTYSTLVVASLAVLTLVTGNVMDREYNGLNDPEVLTYSGARLSRGWSIVTVWTMDI